MVIYDREADDDTELTIKVGDIIKNVVKYTGGWWTGTLNGKTGDFPSNYVELCSAGRLGSPVATPTPPVATATGELLSFFARRQVCKYANSKTLLLCTL